MEIKGTVNKFKWKYFMPLTSEKTSLFNNRGSWYLCIMALLCMLSLFYLGFKFSTYHAAEASDSGLGVRSTLSLQNNDLRIISEKYNSKTRYLEILISKSSGDGSDLQKVETLVTNLSTKKQIPQNLMKITDEYYVLKVPKVPKEFDQLVIDIGVLDLEDDQQLDVDISDLMSPDNTKTTDENSTRNFEQGTWRISGKYFSKTNIKPKSYADYVVQYTELEQEQAQKIINKMDKIINGYEENNKKIESQIKDLRSQERYQTKSEIENTEASITEFKSKIGTNNDQIKQQKATRNELKQKIEKLQLQKNDAKKGIKIE